MTCSANPSLATMQATTPANFQACLHELVGVPYGFRGEGGGLDCWQIVCVGGRELFGLEFPDTFQDAKQSDVVGLMREHRASWQRIERSAAAAGDVVLFTVRGEGLHVGLVLDPPLFLHT